MRLARLALVGLTLLCLGLALSLLVWGVPAWWFLLLALVGYVGVATYGVLVPRLGMFGDVVWRGARHSNAVALTFDDGPSPESTPRIIEALAAHGAKATFFLVGKKAAAHPEVVRRLAAAGHELGMHSYDHEYLYCFKAPGRVAQDIERTREVIRNAAGLAPTLFRPPIGFASHRTLLGARRAGARLVVWTVRGLDGLSRVTPRSIVERVLRRLGPGAIILLHDASLTGDFVPASVEALPELLEALQRRGLRAVTVTELLRPD